jgi:transcriptional regulator with XRE-family HTH domain
MTQKISSRIRQLREKGGLTRTQLAKAVGVTFTGVYNWEENGREPRIDTMTRLAEVLGVSVHYLMTGKEGQREPEPPKAAKTIDALMKRAQSDFAAAMGLPRERVRVTVEEVIGPVGGEVGRRHRSG